VGHAARRAGDRRLRQHGHAANHHHWRDLQLLEGIAEASQVRIIELLILRRIANYRKVTQALGLPESLSDFIDNNLTLGRPVSTHDREASNLSYCNRCTIGGLSSGPASAAAIEAVGVRT
jgi:hypothetical protein